VGSRRAQPASGRVDAQPRRRRRRAARRALVVGSGLGDDAEHVASLGFDTLAFDVSPTAIANIARTVAPGGTLLVISGAREEGEPVDDPPPWPLTPAEIDAFAAGALRMVGLEKRHNPDFPRARFWRAEYGRPAV